MTESGPSFRSGGLFVFDRGSNGEDFRKLGNRFRGYEHGFWYGVTYHHHSALPTAPVWSGSSGRNPRQRLCAEKSCDQICLEGHLEATCTCTLGYEADGTACTGNVHYFTHKSLQHIRHSSAVHFCLHKSTDLSLVCIHIFYRLE